MRYIIAVLSFCIFLSYFLGGYVASRACKALSDDGQLFKSSPTTTVVVEKTVYGEFEKCKKAGGDYWSYTDYYGDLVQHCMLEKEIDLNK